MESGDLIAYGLIPEFVGRFPILAGLSALSEDQLLQVCHMFVSNVYPSAALYSVLIHTHTRMHQIIV